VIHIVLSVQQAITDLPLLLSTPSQTPSDTIDNYGSQVYGARPKAVVIGGGFTDEMVSEMKSACEDVEKGIVWVRFPMLNKYSHTDDNVTGKRQSRQRKGHAASE
jgi:hypothetical protein